MRWVGIRKMFPEQWLIIEALHAHTTNERRRVLDQIAVIETCNNGDMAMKRYRELHKEFPGREFYFVHTHREQLDIQERQWFGIRSSHGTRATG